MNNTQRAAESGSKTTRAKADAPARGETALRSISLLLAVSSAAFASHMIARSDRKPEFSGIEHLAIFSRPARIAAQRAHREEMQIAGKEPEIDYAPVGVIANAGAKAFRVLEAKADSALIRGPRGAVVRVMTGDVLGGLGRIEAITRRDDQWVVVTETGVIYER